MSNLMIDHMRMMMMKMMIHMHPRCSHKHLIQNLSTHMFDSLLRPSHIHKDKHKHSRQRDMDKGLHCMKLLSLE